MSADAKTMKIETERSAALYWQVPIRSGHLSIDRDQSWIQECDRPPQSFARSVSRDAKQSELMDVSDFRYFTWKWRVSNTMDDRNTIDEEGVIQKEGDDFAAKIGITILKKGSDSPREISYVWTRNLPEEKVIVQQKRIVFWKFKYHRIVAESGEEQVGKWVAEARDLYADYKRIYPDEEPGKIVRIYVMSDSDNTESKVTGAFSDLSFKRTKPTHLSPSD